MYKYMYTCCSNTTTDVKTQCITNLCNLRTNNNDLFIGVKVNVTRTVITPGCDSNIDL